MAMASVPNPAPFPRVVGFFRRHPVLLLLALTPGIPEYISGSSVVYPVVTSTGGFLLFLALNLGLYGPGVLLVREAHVRWKKGWSTVILLGGAYGLLEEGTALATLFNPKASVVGGLGSYGHAYGVSWVWLIGVLGVHIVYSVGLPILLLGLALPGTRGQPFLTGYRLPAAVAIYGFDISLLAFALHYWEGALLLVLAAVVAGVLWVVAWRVPAGLLDPPTLTPRRGPRVFLLYGLSYFTILLLAPILVAEAHGPAVLAFSVDGLLVLGLFLTVRHDVGRASNEAQLILLALGALIPIMLFGLLAQLFLPVVLVLDFVVGLFFLTLWRHYRLAPSPITPPPGAVPA
jgi:hypothetical protein